LASLEGGMDIEKVASETPDKIIKFGVDPLGTLSLQDCDFIFLRSVTQLYDIFVAI
jgi:succinyl-CoA synthetase beta subunit